MTTPQGSDDEAIGRPDEWREGRYQQDGKPLPEDPGKSGTDAPQTPAGTPVSTPVTRRDYTGE